MKVTPGIGQKKRQFKSLLGWGKRTMDGRNRPSRSRRRRRSLNIRPKFQKQQATKKKKKNSKKKSRRSRRKG